MNIRHLFDESSNPSDRQHDSDQGFYGLLYSARSPKGDVRVACYELMERLEIYRQDATRKMGKMAAGGVTRAKADKPIPYHSPVDLSPPDRFLASIGPGSGPPAADQPDPPAGSTGSDAPERKTRPMGDPASRAVAAAMALRKEGKPVSVRAACKAAQVDRKNLAANHPETIELIEKLGELDREPPRGSIDRRTGNRDAWDDPEEE